MGTLGPNYILGPLRAQRTETEGTVREILVRCSFIVLSAESVPSVVWLLWRPNTLMVIYPQA